MAHRVSIPQTAKPMYPIQLFKIGCHHCTWYPASSLGGRMTDTWKYAEHITARHRERHPGHSTYVAAV